MTPQSPVAIDAVAQTSDRLLAAADVAKIFNLSLTTVYRLARSGQLESQRFGKGKVRPRGLRIWESSVKAYLRETKTVPAADAA